MDRKRIFAAVSAAAVGVTAFVMSGVSSQSVFSAALGAAQQTAFMAAGIRLPDSTAMQQASTDEQSPDVTAPLETSTREVVELLPAPVTEEAPADETAAFDQEAPQPAAQVISRNITEFDDGLDYTAAGEKSGVIYRKHYTGYSGDDYIELPGGGLIWNCTTDSAETLCEAVQDKPQLNIELNSPEPQVLIVHTHTTESYEPYQRDYYDIKFPFRTRDPNHNMVRVGEVLAQRLADNGISVLHDSKIHDYPADTG